MRQIVEITPVTLKRLRNYRQVAENKMKMAHKKQWMTMTVDSMQEYQQAQKHADHASAVVGYASFLFRVQNGMTPSRTLYGEQLLRNALVQLFKELHIPVVLVTAPAAENEIIAMT